MPQITINIYCKKKACHRKRKRSRRKKNKACKSIYVVNRIKIKSLRICPAIPLFNIRPIVHRYFFVAPYEISLTDENVILPNQFIDDSGEAVHEFAEFGEEGYFNLYINGVMQEGKLYRVNANSITLAATGQHISEGTPIIIEAVGLSASLV